MDFLWGIPLTERQINDLPGEYKQCMGRLINRVMAWWKVCDICVWLSDPPHRFRGELNHEIFWGWSRYSVLFVCFFVNISWMFLEVWHHHFLHFSPFVLNAMSLPFYSLLPCCSTEQSSAEKKWDVMWKFFSHQMMDFVISASPIQWLLNNNATPCLLDKLANVLAEELSSS